MHYFKSRIDIREAAKERLAEANKIVDASINELTPIMMEYGINTPEEIVERLLETNKERKLKNDDEGIKKLISTLTLYERARSTRLHFKFVIDHIANFGEAVEAEDRASSWPVEWHYVKLDEATVSFYFEKYEGLAVDGSVHHPKLGAGKMVGKAYQLEQLIGTRQELGLSTALRR